MRRILFAVSLLALPACTTPRFVKFRVESVQPALVEVGGVSVCDRTPCEIQLKCNKDPMTGYDSDWASQTIVTAVPAGEPAKGAELYTQPKQVNACAVQRGETGALRFDLRMRPVAPVERREVIEMKR
jgi:hypothetical protein